MTAHKVTVIGSGAWGTALGHLMAQQGAQVTAWAFEPEVVEEINVHHENRTFLPGFPLPESYRATHSLQEALQGAELVLIVCPSHVMRTVMTSAAPYLPPEVPLVSATKGIENETLMTMSEVLEDVLPVGYHPMLAFLSGPSFAKEVAQQLPTAVSVAARYERVAARVQALMSAPYFRIYTSTDVAGVELGGALKNVLAIAAGAADGLGLGYNTVTALITRGLAEINRLAIKRGANPLTLAGLAGMGDLVLTCMGGLSRNRMVGQKLGQGLTLEEITRDMRQVAEGVRTARSAYLLAKREEVEMPITATVYRMLYEGLPARDAVTALMSRSLKREL
ncbi:MAG: NAD(P)-dependent glycerol-3-phosphate dehydrogenase [Myxococcales bacterium]|nr:NAD(P)-dependent glycerol-3-phosphate dehydrogenase [Myxococcales bacterium]